MLYLNYNNKIVIQEIKILKKLIFFDSKYDELINIDNSIVNVEKHVFYCDVYAFVDRLKNLVSLRNNNKLKIAIS